MEPINEEHSLALRARDGDRDAVADLVQRMRMRLFSLAYAELRHYEDAQDAVSAGLLQICLHIGRLRQPERVIPWMQRVVRREARRQRRVPHTTFLNPEDVHGVSGDTATLLLRLDIEQALRQLPGQQAQALRLFYMEQLSVREIAARMSGPEGAVSEERVRTWLHRGRRHLAAEMKGYAPMTHKSHRPTPLVAPRRAAILHSELSPKELLEVMESLRSSGFEPELLSPGELSKHRADQASLRDTFKDYQALVVDEMIGGRSGLEYVLFCKAHPETVSIPITFLHGQEEDGLLTAACFAAGVTHLARRDDPKAVATIGEMGEMAKGSWESFTERARRIVMFAQEAAVGLGENYVSTEHLLLGLVREADSAGARVLAEKYSLSLERVAQEVMRRVQRGPGRNESIDMTITLRGKNVVDFAYVEARSLHQGYIGSEHLLLGLIRESDGLAGRVLADLGVDLGKTRGFVAEWQQK